MRARRLYLVLAFTLGALLTPAQADFGLKTFTVKSLDSEGFANLRAASHPYELEKSPSLRP